MATFSKAGSEICNAGEGEQQTAKGKRQQKGCPADDSRLTNTRRGFLFAVCCLLFVVQMEGVEATLDSIGSINFKK